MIRIYLIDDHEMVRAGFKMVLDGATDMVIAGEAGSAEAALPEVKKLKPEWCCAICTCPAFPGWT